MSVRMYGWWRSRFGSLALVGSLQSCLSRELLGRSPQKRPSSSAIETGLLGRGRAARFRVFGGGCRVLRGMVRKGEPLCSMSIRMYGWWRSRFGSPALVGSLQSYLSRKLLRRSPPKQPSSCAIETGVSGLGAVSCSDERCCLAGKWRWAREEGDGVNGERLRRGSRPTCGLDAPSSASSGTKAGPPVPQALHR